MATIAQTVIELADAVDAAGTKSATALDALRDEVRGYRCEVHDLVVICAADATQRQAARAAADAEAITANTRIQRGVSSITEALGRSDVRVALIATGYYLINHLPGWLRGLQ